MISADRRFGLIHYSAFSTTVWFNPLKCFFDNEGLVALDRNPGPGYDTLLLRMIPGDLLSAFPHRQFHTLPGLLDSWAALPNSYPNACMPMQGGSLYHFYDGLWYDPAEANSRPTVREADTLPIEPTRHGLAWFASQYIRTCSKPIYKSYLSILVYDKCS